MKKIGAAFPDFISTEKGRKRRSYDFDSQSFRFLFLLLCCFIPAFILGIKLMQLQIVEGRYWRYLSDGNRLRSEVIHAPRGIIFDRNGTPLVYNVPGFRKKVDGKTVLLSKDEAAQLIAKGKKDLEVDALRQYPLGESMSHVLGYIGQISENELKDEAFSDYQAGDLIGKMGIEKQYESLLKGYDEKQLMEVDSMGKVVRKLGQKDPVPGKNVNLTLDSRVQKAGYEAMKDIKRGALIASKPNGEILALISKPSFDPNFFTMGENYKVSTNSSYMTLESILTDNDKQPLLNRAISGIYPPGSTFKLVVAAAGLEEKLIDEHYSVEDTGVLRSGAYSFSNWYYTSYGGKEGSVNVVKGIKRSNDIFFYKLAEKIGPTNISDWAKRFGVGEILGIDLESESKGLVPDPEWKEKELDESWYLGDTYIYGIGQGYLLTTPLQVNAWTEAIANGGTLYKPHLIKDQKPFKMSKDLLTDKSNNLIRQGMIESCAQGGVAFPFFDFKVKNPNLVIDGKNILEAPQSTKSANFKDYRKITVACKTGTAQHGGEKTLPHAWITLYAPAYNPEIVVTVLAEESGEGSSVAAPIAKKVLETFFSQ